ncbi:MAG TPA: YcgL domain-containing protein [Gammaproteobacteria bacterium]|nr:YcgL domain-containing protein [Gammaproteobacteria bacterium]
MQCAVYKGHKKIDHYLYVEKEGDFSRVPRALLDMLGQLELVIGLDLSPERKLAQADVNEVMQQLREQGYYFQMPPKTGEELLNSKAPN